MLSFALHKSKFTDAIAATRKHESAINAQIAKKKTSPSAGDVTRGYQKALLPLVYFLKDQMKDNRFMKGFNMRIMREIARRVELARDPRVARTRWSARQRRNGRHSRWHQWETLRVREVQYTPTMNMHHRLLFLVRARECYTSDFTDK
ncbi:hypothetical protein RSAG8_09514, partial [Rhizoctonia solani AG-8 WAC10335]